MKETRFMRRIRERNIRIYERFKMMEKDKSRMMMDIYRELAEDFNLSDRQVLNVIKQMEEEEEEYPRRQTPKNKIP